MTFEEDQKLLLNVMDCAVSERCANTEDEQALDRVLSEYNELREALVAIVERHAPGDGEADYDIARKALNDASGA